MATDDVPAQNARDRFRQADALLDAALDQPAGNRLAWVAAATHHDASLRNEVLSLLRAHDDANGAGSGFLATRDGGAANDSSSSTPGEAAQIDRHGLRQQELARALDGRYRVDRHLASGGMASVFLAHDLRHDRPVAIKVFGADVRAALGGTSGVNRFLSEIRVMAQLQHPHIVPLYDSGTADGVPFYVMPFVAGQSLRQYIERHAPMPVADAVALIATVADAVAVAHARGIVHRDLKPENILIQHEQPQVTDFGIAFALAEASATADGEQPERLTGMGVLIGTPRYMSPEQAAGERALDARTDVYALGAIVYELLTGDPPHVATTVQGVLAKVRAEPALPVHLLRDGIPAAVSQVIAHALAKHPADRVESAAAFAAQLRAALRVTDASTPSSLERSPPPVASMPAARRRSVWTGVAAVFAVATLVVLVVLVRRRPPASNVSDTSIAGLDAAAGSRVAIPVRAELASFPNAADGRVPVLSPDGQFIAYAGSVASDRAVYIRRLDELAARPIPGTRNALMVAISPNSQWVAFITDDDRLYRVPVTGGPITAVAGIFRFGALSWADDEHIVGQAFGSRGLDWIRVGDTSWHPLTTFDSSRAESMHFGPLVLPDHRTVIFTVARARSGVDDLGGDLAVVTFDPQRRSAATHTLLGITAGVAVGYLDGYLLYTSGDGQRLLAQPFDLAARRLTGRAATVLTHDDGSIHFASTSRGGALLYQLDARASRVVRVERDGRTVPLAGDLRAEAMNPRLSPRGDRPIIMVATPVGNDAMLIDLVTRDTTSLGIRGTAVSPTWTPDGRSIIYMASGGTEERLYRVAATPGAQPELLVSAAGVFGPSVSRDGLRLLYQRYLNGVWSIWTSLLDGDRTPRAVISGRANAYEPALSPDGRWLAYASDSTGRYEVYLRPFLREGSVVRVSERGGSEPAWSKDGTRLYFRGNGHMCEATVQQQPTLRVTGVRELYADHFDDTNPMPHRNYDIVDDGRAFVAISKTSGGQSHVVLVTDWLAGVRAGAARR